MKIDSKKGIWKRQKNFTLRLKKVSWVALLTTTRFYIPFDSTCCLFVAYYNEFRNTESYDKFVLPVEGEL